MNVNHRSPVASPWSLRVERSPSPVTKGGPVSESCSASRTWQQRRCSTWRLAALCLSCVLFCAGAESSASAAEETGEESVQPNTGQIVLVIGAAGTEQYGQEFQAWAKQWRQIAEQAEVPITVVGESNEGADQDAETEDRQQLQRAVESLASEETSPAWIVLIGHGTFTRGVAKFNLRGPDVSAEEMAQWLTPLKRPVVVVNCASSSSPFINGLSAENRVIVTATRSGTEQNYARFGKYFAEAMASPQSDLDHDDEVSVHEAFLRASAEVRQFYETEGRIATEHALIDDNGDGKGSPATMFRGTRPNAKAKDGAKVDGARASRITLAPATDRLPLTEQELKDRDELERALDQLRQRKAELDPQQYKQELETLLIQLARIYQAAETRQQDGS